MLFHGGWLNLTASHANATKHWNYAAMDEVVRSNYHQVLSKIARGERSPGATICVAVSKRQPIEKLITLQGNYCPIVFGENYVQEAQQKKIFLAPHASLHLIGPLQSNKVKLAVSLFEVIQSVHSIAIANAISKNAVEQQKRQHIFLQVNISRDTQKQGFSAESLPTELEKICKLPGLALSGLMAITRQYENPTDARADFEQLRSLATQYGDQFSLHGLTRARPFECSMGMSQDYEVAVAAGASIVRVGAAIFGDRA